MPAASMKALSPIASAAVANQVARSRATSIRHRSLPPASEEMSGVVTLRLWEPREATGAPAGRGSRGHWSFSTGPGACVRISTRPARRPGRQVEAVALRDHPRCPPGVLARWLTSGCSQGPRYRRRRTRPGLCAVPPRPTRSAGTSRPGGPRWVQWVSGGRAPASAGCRTARRGSTARPRDTRSRTSQLTSRPLTARAAAT